jgi:DNA invertase Pin-like site-specific DNA recombinase
VGSDSKSLHDKIDTTSATGRLVFHILAALSLFEREITRERIEAGREAARARGQRFGRPISALTPDRVRLIDQLLDHGMPRSEIARGVGISRSTLYQRIRQRELESAG